LANRMQLSACWRKAGKATARDSDLLICTGDNSTELRRAVPWPIGRRSRCRFG
jgi:hypothetical protein